VHRHTDLFMCQYTLVLSVRIVAHTYTRAFTHTHTHTHTHTYTHTQKTTPSTRQHNARYQEKSILHTIYLFRCCFLPGWRDEPFPRPVRRPDALLPLLVALLLCLFLAAAGRVL
jgi:hypothetical protein